MYLLTFARDGGAIPWTSPTLISVTGFLRETILRLDDPRLGPEERRRTGAVFRDALQPLSQVGLDLPMPNDPRVRRITDALLADPADGRTIADWGRRVGASTRTLARLFTAETGMTFAQWRLQARVQYAIVALADDLPVGEVARRVGYGSTSAFVFAFRRSTGITPTALASQLRVDAGTRGTDKSRTKIGGYDADRRTQD